MRLRRGECVQEETEGTSQQSPFRAPQGATEPALPRRNSQAPSSSLLPRWRWAALRRRDRTSFRVQDGQTGGAGGAGVPSLSPIPSHECRRRHGAGSLPGPVLTLLGTPGGPHRTHMLTPLTSFPGALCFSMV